MTPTMIGRPVDPVVHMRPETGGTSNTRDPQRFLEIHPLEPSSTSAGTGESSTPRAMPNYEIWQLDPALEVRERPIQRRCDIVPSLGFLVFASAMMGSVFLATNLVLAVPFLILGLPIMLVLPVSLSMAAVSFVLCGIGWCALHFIAPDRAVDAVTDHF